MSRLMIVSDAAHRSFMTSNLSLPTAECEVDLVRCRIGEPRGHIGSLNSWKIEPWERDRVQLSHCVVICSIDSSGFPSSRSHAVHACSCHLRHRFARAACVRQDLKRGRADSENPGNRKVIIWPHLRLASTVSSSPGDDAAGLEV